MLLVAAAFTVFFGTVFPLLSEAVRGVKVSVGAPFFNQVNVPLFLSLIFLMGVGPLIAWRRASLDNLKRNFLWPVVLGIVAAAIAFAVGVRSALATLTFATDGVRRRHDRSRCRAGDAGAPAARRAAFCPAVGGLLRRHNRRYGGFVVHLGILVIALGVTGSHAWSVQTETTLQARRDRGAGRVPRPVRRASPRAEESNHFKVVGTFTVTNGARSAC